MQTEQPESHPIFLLKFLRQARRGLAFSIMLATVSAVLDLVPYAVGASLIAALVAGTATAQDFGIAAVVLLASIPVSFFAFGAATKRSHTIAFDILRQIRAALFQSCQAMALGRLKRMRSGEMRRLFLDEPERLELLIAHAIPEVTSAVFSWFIVTLWLAFLDWRIALLLLILSLVAFVCLGFALSTSAQSMGVFQAQANQQSAQIGEALAGMAVLQSYAAQTRPERNLRCSFQTLGRFKDWLGQGFAPMGAAYFVLISANLSFLLPVGLLLLSHGSISVDVLLICLILGGNYSLPLARLLNVFRDFAHIAGSIQQIQQAITTPPQPNSGQELMLDGHDITVEGACLTLGGKDILNNVSCQFKSGSFTAIVGPSGAGKSTLCEALLRFSDLDHGRITIGEQDIAAMDLGQLMGMVSFVFQDNFLFHGTIAENLRVAKPDATDAELEQAARAASAHVFITELPHGYDTVIGSGTDAAQVNATQRLGHQLSGGQAQRLAIARAILQDRPIIILDEATAAVDPEHETLVQQAISRLVAGRTLIVIAHRLHRIVQADQILVMDQGRIVQQGRHAELQQQCGLYRDLWQAAEEGEACAVEQAPNPMSCAISDPLSGVRARS